MPSFHPQSAVAGVKLRLFVKGLVLMASLAALGWVMKATGFAEALDTRWIDVAVKGHGISGEMLLLGVGGVAMAVGFPRQAICFLAGYAFGFVTGVAVASLASLFGCVLCFLYARLLGRELVNHRFSARVKAIDSFLGEDPFLMTVLIRFLPVGSNLLTNLVAGVSSVRPWPFLAGSLIGYLPQTVVFVLLGSGIHVDQTLRIGLSVVLFVVSAVLGVVLYRRLRHGRALGAEIDAQILPPDGPVGA